jgi:hypothetical protein
MMDLCQALGFHAERSAVRCYPGTRERKIT